MQRALLLFGWYAPFSGPVGFVIVAYVVFLAVWAALLRLRADRVAVVNGIFIALISTAAAITVGALVAVIASTLWKGRQALVHVNFFTQDMSKTGPLDSLKTGGVLHALVGTLWMIGIAVVLTAPLGILTAVYLYQSRSRFSRFVRSVVVAMTALPTILAGLFIYAFWILTLGNEKSALAAALALSVMMLPYIIRGADLVLRLVPGNLVEASSALGAPRWRTVWHVVLPSARSGLATAVILGVARGIGEASPVLLTAGFTTYLNTNPIHGPMVSLPLLTLKLAQSPTDTFIARGYACRVVLVARGARALHHRSRHRRPRRRCGLGARPTPPRARVGPRSRTLRTPRQSLDGAGTVSGGCRMSITRKRVAAMLSIGLAALFVSALAMPAQADSYVPVSGAGSTWSENALSQWIRDVQQYGMRINYAGTGSSDGRRQYLNGTVDFAASDIPFQSHPEDGSAPENPTPGTYAYMPITAGGTVFMYNLTINGQRVTNLRLSGENVVKIFTRVITTWNDPAIEADNPGLKLPDEQIVPVVRSDGSAATYHLTEWMIDEYGPLWNSYCSKSGRAPACGPTSLYPTVPGVIAQAGDLGIAGYVSQNYAAGSIGFVNYSYALNTHFPVAKLLNSAGYYTEPTAQNVAVSLLKAQINTTSTDPSLYLTQNLTGVFSDPDPRTYVLSSYGYLILPTKIQGQFTAAKGKTLAAFASYAMCQGQQESASLGYSPMPVNLVQAGFTQIAKIPGAVSSNVNIATCHNPTFSPDGTNLLAKTAPMPPACDKQGPTQCSTGTGGARQPTRVVIVTGTGGGGSSGGSGGSTGGGQTTSGGGSAATSSGSTAGGSSTGGGSTATGSSSTGGSGTGGATGSGSGATSNTTACDPSSGTCGAVASAGSGSGSGSGSNIDAASGSLSATPVVLTAASGWGSTQVLMLIALVLLIAVIVVPAFLVRRFRNEETR